MTVRELYVCNMDMTRSTRVSIYGSNSHFRGECSDIPIEVLTSIVVSFYYSDGAYIIMIKD